MPKMATAVQGDQEAEELLRDPSTEQGGSLPAQIPVEEEMAIILVGETKGQEAGAVEPLAQEATEVVTAVETVPTE